MAGFFGTVIGILAVGLVFIVLNPLYFSEILEAVIAGIFASGLAIAISGITETIAGSSSVQVVRMTCAVIVLAIGAIFIYSLFHSPAVGLLLGVLVLAGAVALVSHVLSSRRTSTMSARSDGAKGR